jgi:DNA gyrase subunit B
MMDRDFGTEIDGLKEELRQIRQVLLIGRLPRTKTRASEPGQDVLSAAGREQLDDLRDQLVSSTAVNNLTGAVAYAGTFCSGDDESTRQSIWAMAVPADSLLDLNKQRMVEKVLASIGNSQRLDILLALLRKPMTVNQLVEALGSNTTGQIYHHLKPLLAADILREEKGVYAVLPYRVQGIVMLLAGVYDLTDSRYTSGTWEE